jgi:hypothetical protein
MTVAVVMMVVVAVVMMVIMAVVVVVAVVIVIPMAFMYLPALLVMVVVGVGPIGSCIGWALPGTGHPHIVIASNAPVTIDPGVALCWYRWSRFIADRRRRGADINLNLAECRDCQGRCNEDAT